MGVMAMGNYSKGALEFAGARLAFNKPGRGLSVAERLSARQAGTSTWATALGTAPLLRVRTPLVEHRTYGEMEANCLALPRPSAYCARHAPCRGRSDRPTRIAGHSQSWRSSCFSTSFFWTL